MVIKTSKFIENYRAAHAASRLRRLEVAFSIALRSSGATRLWWQQSASQQIQIGKRKARVQARGVLHQPAITDFVEPPESLDHVKGMLDPGSGGGAPSVDEPLIFGQRNVRRSAIDAVADALRQGRLTMRLVPVGLVAKHFALSTVQQFGHLRTVVPVRHVRAKAVADPAAIRADVRLHTEMPVFSLLRLAHLRVSRALLILRRWRRGNEGGVHNRAALEQQTLLLEQAANLGEYLLRQFVLLQKMAKPQYRRFVRYVMSEQFDSGKAAHRLDVVEGVFGLRIRQIEPGLHKVDT